MNRSRWTFKYILCALIIATLLISGAYAEQVVRFDYKYGEEAQGLYEQNQPNVIVFNGNTYVFTDARASFTEAFSPIGRKTLSLYELTVPKDRIAEFREPEDRYLGNLAINPPAGTEMELYICVGDRNTGVYTVGDPIKTSTPYSENIHATLDSYDTLQIIDRIYLYSYEENGQRVYNALGLYIDYEDYNASLLESVVAANLAADSLPTPEPVIATPEPTEETTPEPTEAPTPEPTEAPTPEPTEAPTPEPTEAPTPEPTEAPTPEPTEAPTPEPTEAPTPEPTEAPTMEPTEAPTPEPTEEPTHAPAIPAPVETDPPKDSVSLEQIDINAENVDVNGASEMSPTDDESGTIRDFLPLLIAAALIALLILLALLFHRRKKKGVDETAQRRRFFRLVDIDERMRHQKPAVYEDIASLEALCSRFRDFASSRLHLYYSQDMIRCFIASFAASRLIIMQGISGTGKTSLAYAFGKFVQNDACIIPVQPSWRERSDLLGYFNEFTKRFNETELLEKIYESQYNRDIYISVLDEMNIARVEYYFAEFLSILEMPNPDEWIVSIVPDHWALDPVKLDNGRLRLPRNMWFIGTANNDDSTFAISDKVYDRAMVLDIDSKAEPFNAQDTPPLHLSSERFEALLNEAKQKYSISAENIDKIQTLDSYIIKHLRVAFGNRIMNQFHNFVPVYMACGGAELDGIDYILSKKVLRKLESQNLAYIRDEIDDLCDYLDELFGCGAMKNSIDYLKRLKKLG